MSAFPNWQKFAVQQKRDATGCIPTGYETLLRAAGATGVDFATFQDEFDLDQFGGAPRNHFDSVAKAVTVKYPGIEFTCNFFKKGDGAAKLAKIEERIQKQQPVLVSLANSIDGSLGWHIMPVVDADRDSLTLLHHVDKSGAAHTQNVKKPDFVFRHDNWKGGEEIAYLSKF